MIPAPFECRSSLWRPYAIIPDSLASPLGVGAFTSSQPRRLTIREHLILGDERETGLRREGGINEEAERLNLDFTYGPIGPRLLCLNLTSELLSEAREGISGINTQGEGTQQSEETCHVAGVCRRHCSGCP